MSRTARLLASLFYLTVALGWWVTTVQAGVTIDWVTVGDPGNAADYTGYGAVAYTYRISKYETTNAQYAELLNAVAATDTNGLYNVEMGSGYGGITRSGSSGSYTYDAIAGREDMPVNWVSFYDMLRFANWLHNGQPTGAQDSTTTEDGAYDMSLGSSVVRKAGANVFVTDEDEWYKAAYYAGSGTYYEYPVGSDTQTTCAAPGPAANTANCNRSDLTDVGGYTGSASPNGTFDQGGNLWELNEALAIRGGAFTTNSSALAASVRFPTSPTLENYFFGFRVASFAGALDVEALHDIPQPVQVRAQGWDSSCNELYNTVMEWTNNDETYGTETTTIPSSTVTLRFTFINDYFAGGGDPDDDRNFYLDYWYRDGSITQGEDWDRTGGPDPYYAGCDQSTWLGRSVTGCGNQGDAVEYGPACVYLPHCQGSGCISGPGVPALGGWGFASLVGLLVFLGSLTFPRSGRLRAV